MRHELIKIIECITDGNTELIKELEACILNTSNYYKKHKEAFLARGIAEGEEEKLIQWITVVNILDREGYVTECDWKEEKDNFLFNLSNLNGIKSRNLQLESNWFKEDGEITEWLEILDKKWEKDGMAIFAFDINSDSYVLFPFEVKKFKKLDQCAKKAGYRIAYGKDM